MFPVRRNDLNTRAIDGEAVILDRAAGKVHQLNTTASFIWDNCDGTRSAADIAERVAESFDVSLDAAMEDVTRTLTELAELGLIQSEPKVL